MIIVIAIRFKHNHTRAQSYNVEMLHLYFQVKTLYFLHSITTEIKGPHFLQIISALEAVICSQNCVKFSILLALPADQIDKKMPTTHPTKKMQNSLRHLGLNPRYSKCYYWYWTERASN